MEHILLEIGVAFTLIALAGVLSWRLRFPIAPLLILIGMAVGPHAPQFGALDLRFIVSRPLIDLMGRLGVVLMMFDLGLEFSIGRLARAGQSILAGGLIYMAINFTLGIAFPLALGWPLRETLVAAGITTISSTVIVAKVLVDLRRTANPETELILGLMMFQDVFFAIYLSLLSGIVRPGGASPLKAIVSTAAALSVIAALFLARGRLMPLLNRCLNIPSDEVFLLILIAILMAAAGLAEAAGITETLGALLAGLVLAETEHRERIEHLLAPFRDLFGALFFFSFGLRIDPLSLGGGVGIALGAVALTLIGNFAAGLLMGRSAGLSYRAATNIGLTITCRGECSIILADLGRKGGLLATLQPFAALYVLLLAVLGPLLTRESKLIYQWLSRILGWPRAKAAAADRERRHSL